MEITSIAEQLLFTGVRIESIVVENKRKIGTGFILDYRMEGKSYPFIITAKHIISGAEEGVLTFIKGKRNIPLLGEGYQLKIKDFEKI